MFFAVLSLLAHFALPVNLDGIGLERVRVLFGRVVVASFVASEPYSYPEFEITTIGAQARDHGAERVAVL
jgi:hypothetical protein